MAAHICIKGTLTPIFAQNDGLVRMLDSEQVVQDVNVGPAASQLHEYHFKASIVISFFVVLCYNTIP